MIDPVASFFMSGRVALVSVPSRRLCPWSKRVLKGAYLYHTSQWLSIRREKGFHRRECRRHIVMVPFDEPATFDIGGGGG